MHTEKQLIHIYERMTPIDYWEGWIPLYYLEEDEPYEIDIALLLARILSVYAYTEDYKYGSVDPHSMADYITRAVKELKSHTDWEGDGSIYIAGLPCDDGTSGDYNNYLIAVKQGNNGDTFIISPKKLSWLEKDLKSYEGHIKRVKL